MKNKDLISLLSKQPQDSDILVAIISKNRAVTMEHLSVCPNGPCTQITLIDDGYIEKDNFNRACYGYGSIGAVAINDGKVMISDSGHIDHCLLTKSIDSLKDSKKNESKLINSTVALFDLKKSGLFPVFAEYDEEDGTIDKVWIDFRIDLEVVLYEFSAGQLIYNF